MSAIATFLFGIVCGGVLGIVVVVLAHGMIGVRRARKLKELERYQQAARRPHNPGTLEQYLRSSERDGV